jgi:hypothetical protein
MLTLSRKVDEYKSLNSDFMKQRCRWFSGLWLCVVCPDLALWRRVMLGSFVVSWQGGETRVNT